MIKKIAPILALSLLWLGACGSDELELKCENAVAHIARCCPGFDPGQISCIDYHPGPGCFNSPCNGGDRNPDITAAQSQCLIGRGCDDLRAHGACDSFARAAVGHDLANLTEGLGTCAQ